MVLGAALLLAACGSSASGVTAGTHANAHGLIDPHTDSHERGVRHRRDLAT